MLARLVLLAFIRSLAAGETFDLGDLDQYNGGDDSTDLSANALLLSRADSNDLRVELGPDTQAAVESTVDACGDFSNQCYQDVYQVLNEAHLELDSQYDKRELITLISATTVAIGALVSALAGIFVQWRLNKGEESLHVVNIPETKASEAAVFGGDEPVTVSADGSAVVTVTPTAEPTSLQGEVEPTIVPVEEAIEGYEPGDFMAKLDPDLAGRVDEIMHRMQDCSDGRSFDSDNNNRKRAGGSLGQAICGAQGAASAVQPGGALNDLLLMNGPTFKFRSEEIAAAAQVVVDFVRDYAPLMNIDAAVATPLGQTLFVLAIDTIMNDIPLAAENPIKQDLVTEDDSGDSQITETPGPTPTDECPRPTACAVGCKGVGDKFYFCETECVTKTTECATGTSARTITTTAVSEWDLWPQADSESGSGAPSLEVKDPECDQSDRTPFPWNLFYGETNGNNVVDSFCQEVGKDQGSELKWTVNATGTMLTERKKRMPPTNPDHYSDWEIYLTWEPTEDVDMESCPATCVDVYKGIANGPCGRSGGASTDMTIYGSQNIGCGTYYWKIFDPDGDAATDPDEGEETHEDILGEIECNPDEMAHDETIEEDLDISAEKICRELPTEFGPDTEKWEKSVVGEKEGKKMYFSVEWEEGCTTAKGKQDAGWPTDQKEQDRNQLVCINMFENNWSMCESENQGNGGSRRAGCLIYSYKPE